MSKQIKYFHNYFLLNVSRKCTVHNFLTACYSPAMFLNRLSCTSLLHWGRSELYWWKDAIREYITIFGVWLNEINWVVLRRSLRDKSEYTLWNTPKLKHNLWGRPLEMTGSAIIPLSLVLQRALFFSSFPFCEQLVLRQLEMKAGWIFPFPKSNSNENWFLVIKLWHIFFSGFLFNRRKCKLLNNVCKIFLFLVNLFVFYPE